MEKPNRFLIVLLSLLLLGRIVAAAPAPGNAPEPATFPSLSVLADFGAQKGDPVLPQKIGRLSEGPGGALYGTTPGGGAHGVGTVYKVTLDGAMTILYSFDTVHGSGPLSGLTRGPDGDFYGTTNGGGKYAAGTIFKIAPGGGEPTILWDFRNGRVVPPVRYPQQPTEQQVLDAAGSYPLSGPVPGPDGSLYGVVPTGNIQRDGIFYQITPSGDYRGLHNFHAEKLDYPCALILGRDGIFYGTTLGGTGANRYGAVFKATPAGDITVLRAFDIAHGLACYNLIQGLGSDDNLYGTANLNGPNGRGVVYKVTLGGDLTVLHGFNGHDGAGPIGGVIPWKDGTLYGVTSWGGTGPGGLPGVLFRVGTDGQGFEVLMGMTGATGFASSAPLLQHTNGKLYGTCGVAGKYLQGTLFALDPDARFYVTDLCLDLPQLVTVNGGRTLVQSVWARGTGKGMVSGHWRTDGTAGTALPDKVTDLTLGTWVKIGQYRQPLVVHHKGGRFTLDCTLDSPNALTTSPEAVAWTGFIPSMDGWAFGNTADSNQWQTWLLPFTGTGDLNRSLDASVDGFCEGMTLTARSYYQGFPGPPARTPDGSATPPITALIHRVQVSGNNTRAASATPDFLAALSPTTRTDPIYTQALNEEAAAIQSRVQTGDPCPVDIYEQQNFPGVDSQGHSVPGMNPHGHSVLVTASFFSADIYLSQPSSYPFLSQSKIKEMHLFSIYDPNFPRDDGRYLGSFDAGTARPTVLMIPPGIITPTLWLPNKFDAVTPGK